MKPLNLNENHQCKENQIILREKLAFASILRKQSNTDNQRTKRKQKIAKTENNTSFAQKLHTNRENKYSYNKSKSSV